MLYNVKYGIVTFMDIILFAIKAATRTSTKTFRIRTL